MDSKKLLQLFSKALFATVLLAVLGLQTASAQSTIFVSSTTGSDAFTGATTSAGPTGPKATLAGALAIASAGDTISIEAGAYTEATGFAFSGTGDLTIVVRLAGSVTDATFSGAAGAVIAPGAGDTITLTGGDGSIAVSAPIFDLTTGSIALGTDKLAFSADPTAVSVTAGTASGASPNYGGQVNVDYSIADDHTAGTELPANLDGGTVSVTSIAGDDLTIGSGFVAGDVDASGAAGDVSITGNVTLDGNFDADGAGDVSLTGDLASDGSVYNAAGDLTVTGATEAVGTVDNGDTATFASLEVNDGTVANSGTMVVTGSLSFATTTAGGGGFAAISNTAAGDLTVGSLDVTTESDDDDVADVTIRLVDNDGDLTVNGTTVAQEVDDEDNTTDDVTDMVAFDVDNGAGDATFTGASEIATFTNGAGTATFGADVTVHGGVTNAGDIELGSNTLTADLDGGAGHGFGTVNGAGSTVSVTGDTDTAGIDSEGSLAISGDGNLLGGDVAGDLTISGDGDVAGATTVGGDASVSGDGDVLATLNVTGDLSLSGDNNLAAAVTVEGDATFAGVHVDTAGGHDVDGAATISGSLDIIGGGATFGSATVTSTGSLLMDGATLTVEGDFDTSNGGTFDADAAGSMVIFNMAANSTHSPGPNTEIANGDVMGAFTLTMAQSIAVSQTYTVDAASTVDLGDFLIREVGGGTVTINGDLVTDSGTDGALAFEAGGATLDGLGTVSNILVNITGGGDVFVGSITATDVTFSGTLTLFDGGLEVGALDSDVSPTGTAATVSRNLGGTGTDVTLSGLGTFNDADNEYILTVFGGVAGALGELAATGVTTLNVQDTGTIYTTAGAATVGNINVEDGATLTLGADLEAEGAVDNDGDIDGAFELSLTGADMTHSNVGTITSTTGVYATGVTINGSTDDSDAATLTDLAVGDGGTGDGAVTIVNIQEIDGDVDVDDNGWASIGLAGEDGDAGTVASGFEGIVKGNVSVADDGTVMWTSDAGIDGDVTGVGVSTFDFNGNTISMAVGSDFDTEDEAVFGTSGTLEFDGAGSLGTEGAVLPGLTANTGTVTLNSDVAVSGTTTIEDTATIDTGAFSLDVAGAVALDATTSGGVTGAMSISGTTVTLASDYTVTGTLEIDATSVDFAADDATDDWVFEVTGDYTQTAGDVSLTNVDLRLTGGTFDYTAGAFTAASDDDNVVFAGAVLDTNDGTLSIPNVVIFSATTVGADDTLTVSNYLTLSDDLTIGADGTLNIDGTYIYAASGIVDASDADATLAFGNAAGLTIEYDGTDPSGDENPGTFGALIVSDDLTMTDDMTVDAATIAAAADNTGADLTITDGGTLTMEAPGVLLIDVVLAGTYNLTYDGAQITADEAWTGSPVLTTIASGTVSLDVARSTVGLTIDTGATFALGAFPLTITGDVTNNGTITGGPVVFAGTSVLSGGVSIPAVTLAGDITLVDGDLDVTAAGCGDLTLTSGVITTGGNNVIICHTSTADQGFTRGTGVVFGNVQTVVNGLPGGNVTDRVEFPLGDAAGNYRPFAMTFNSPQQLGASPVLTVSYNDSNPGGLNGFPIAGVDDLGAAFSISRYTTDFHWEVSASPSVTPNIDYDVEYRAASFSGFDGENIEKTRAIRRQAGNDANFWIKVANGASDNDNYAVSATEPVMVARNAVGAINTDAVLFAIGLEANLAGATAAVAMNAGGSKTVAVAAVVSGGSPPYTITYTGDDAVATASDDGTTVTVVGVGAGSTAIAVNVTDSFGETTTGTINATVNAAFAAGTALADLAAVLVGAADASVDASGMTSGGTAPIVYTIDAGTDVAVATATIDAATGVVTVTYGTAGSTTFTVTATDAEGAAVTDDFTASVVDAAGANGTLANQTVNNGSDGAAQDLSTEFSGTAPFTYAASSSDDDVATATTDDTAGTVTASGVSPYTVVAGAVTADAAAATITVTATDAFGSTISSTFDVEVNPVLGNVDGSGGVGPASASLALDGFLGLATLTTKQTLAADYNVDATVTPFDAALIFDAWLNPTTGAASKKEFAANPASDVAFGEVSMQVTNVTIPVTLTGNQAAAISFSFETSIDSELATVTGVTGVEGWTIRHIVGEDGSLRIAGFGLEAIPSDGVVATISLELTSVGTEFALRGQGAVNNNPATDIEGIDVVELPENFALLGNYPNPFNPSTSISFDLPASADVSIEVYDMLGRRVMVLPMQTIQAGSKRSVQLNASQLASGSYFYRVIAQMESKTQVDNGRMTLIK
jgi:hypothetical protein